MDQAYLGPQYSNDMIALLLKELSHDLGIKSCWSKRLTVLRSCVTARRKPLQKGKWWGGFKDVWNGVHAP